MEAMGTILDNYAPTVEEERDHWNGQGHIEFFVNQNVDNCFEIEILDSSGCAGGLEETLGINYAIYEGIIDVDLSELRQGFTYKIHGLNVTWFQGDGWEIDDDSEYSFTELTRTYKLWPLIKHTLFMFWWQNIGWKNNWRRNQ